MARRTGKTKRTKPAAGHLGRRDCIAIAQRKVQYIWDVEVGDKATVRRRDGIAYVEAKVIVRPDCATQYPGEE